MDMQKETIFSEVETANSKQLSVLKANFPQCFDKNGAFIQEKLLEIVKSSDVELSKESYSLNWLGKSYARLLANLPPKTLLSQPLTKAIKPCSTRPSRITDPVPVPVSSNRGLESWTGNVTLLFLSEKQVFD